MTDEQIIQYLKDKKPESYDWLIEHGKLDAYLFKVRDSYDEWGGYSTAGEKCATCMFSRGSDVIEEDGPQKGHCLIYRYGVARKPREVLIDNQECEGYEPND